ncbi:hypothetical protein LLEC1_00415 [Akanthomyces lecanii]|uniref:Glutathione S-transferase n=1 Tax=Cordyceps confragosa TaxID=2714763 RepID=A0A179I4Z6_CORDF|nr:hypothetical protein LLEC1_00415 [Akanthomyces lecanii]
MSTPPYELIYAPFAPGRGEHIRLLLEEAGVTYTDTTSLGWDAALAANQELLKGRDGNPPYFAPPLFRHGDLIISQTSNILMYLGSKLGLAGSTAEDAFRVNALACTALDGLSDEVHATHHPISGTLYYEDQKDESTRASKVWINVRLPKFLAYWESVLASKGGPWLMGETFTYADIVLSQCIDGVKYAFPKAMAHLDEKSEYRRVFGHWEQVRARPRIAKYLASDKRQKYDNGIYRYCPDGDVVPETAAASV